MKIVWQENPLTTYFEFNDQDKELFRAKVQLHELREWVGMADFYLETKYDSFSPEKAKHYTHKVWNDEGDFEDFEESYNLYLHELESGVTHIGDCTCFAASCLKCHAEGILGIDTIAGLGKHEGHKIFSAFETYKTIDEVLEYLKDYPNRLVMHKNWEGKEESWKTHIPRWTKEAESAYKWLLNYKETKLGDLI